MHDIVLNSIIAALKEQRTDRLHRRWTPGTPIDKDAEIIVEAFAVLQAVDDAGWQLMPKTPTNDMLEAEHSGEHWGNVPTIYRKMLDAAPKIGEKVDAD